MAPTRYASLHNHTSKSLLDGHAKGDALVARAKELGMPALAITDHGAMYGVIEFYAACKKADITPIIGLEAYCAPRSMKQREPRIDDKNPHLTLLATNEAGYGNLLKITSAAHLDGFYYKPRTDKAFLAAHADGIVCLTGCMSGAVARAILSGDDDLARREAYDLVQIFGHANVFVEVHNQGLKDQPRLNRGLVALARDMGLPLVAANDVHYVHRKDATAHDLLLCVQTSRSIDDDNRLRMDTDQFYLRSYDEMAAAFAEIPDALANTLRIAERVDLRLDFDRVDLPRFDLGDETPIQYLRRKVYEGLEWRFGTPTREQIERVEYELGVIERTGYPLYFLIVADYVNHARSNGIMAVPRGSVAGSLCIYALGICDINPLEWGLMFERFLHEERIGMPDIDMDFPDKRREEVIRYVQQKYGRDRVAQIITFGTMAARNAVRDAARALGIPYGEADRLAKAIPHKDSIAQAAENAEIRELLHHTPHLADLLRFARSLEDIERNASTHAAGVVISGVPLVERVPLQRGTKGEEGVITQWDMNVIEKIGMLKMDFLGLANLTILGDAVALVKTRHGVDIDLAKLPKDYADPTAKRTFDMLAAGYTTAVFQFECVAGDTILNGDPRKTIAQVYRAPYQRMMSVDLGTGKRRSNRVLAVVKSGEKQLYRLNTDGGYILRATADHRILTREGWVRLGDLGPGAEIAVNTRDASRIGACIECGVQIKARGHRCKKCENERRDSGRIMSRNRDPQKWQASLRRGRSHPFWGKLREANLSYSDLPHRVRSRWEADYARIQRNEGIAYEYEPRTFTLSNGSTYTPDYLKTATREWVEVKGRGGLCGESKRKVDQFRRDYPNEKLTVVCAHEIAEYEIAHPNDQPWGCPELPSGFGFERVKSITKDRVEMTYDVAMEAPYNNYIANGIVVHNSVPMRRYLRQLRPNHVFDLMAMVALYRPGPMENIPAYIEGKNGAPVTYLHPSLEPILKETFGVLTYQDQVLLAVRALAGYSWGEADVLRKAMGKKIPALMAEQEAVFRAKMAERGHPDDLITVLWELISPFSGYGFPAAHAAAYALVAYQTAWMKANYPYEYMACVLSAEAEHGNTAKVAEAVMECHRLGIPLLPLDVNRSGATFGIESCPGGRCAIRFGLSTIKGLGDAVVASVLAPRARGGPFTDLLDVCRRVDLAKLNVLAAQRLIKSGAMADFGDANGLLAALDAARDLGSRSQRASRAGQTSLFDLFDSGDYGSRPADLTPVLAAPVAPLPERVRLAWEKEATGLYLTGHPLRAVASHLAECADTAIAEITDEMTGERVTIGGLVANVRPFPTKKGQVMAVIEVEDLGGSAEVVVFPRAYEQYSDALRVGSVVVIAGTVESREEKPKLICESLETLAEPADSVGYAEVVGGE